MANTQTYSNSPYPFNLLEKLHYSFDPKIQCELSKLPRDYRGTIDYILRETLTVRERTIIKWRAEQRRTIESVASSLGLSRERVRQCERRALEKMSTGRNRFLLIFGISNSLIERDETEFAFSDEGDHDNTSVHLLGLSTRACNALWRGGYQTVDDLKFLEEEDIYELHNVGVKTAEEIIAMLKRVRAAKGGSNVSASND